MSLRTGKFTQRNAFYLRISPTTVLQLLLLLDHRHVEWMSSEMLEKVLNVLKTHISLKLGAENMHMSKKRREADSEKIDVFRGAGWQMAYYFRKQEHRHAVLLKNKDITFEPFSKTNPRPAPQEEVRPKRRKRKAVEIRDDDSSGDEAQASTSNGADAIRIKEEDEDEETLPPPLSRGTLGDEDDEDEKPEGKPKLKVSYNGFSIYGKLLVVIVEPYPPLREQSRAPFGLDQRELSVGPLLRNTRETSEFAVPTMPEQRDRSRSRSESLNRPLASASNPLFRPETPIPDDDEDLEGFRARSQSIMGYNPALAEDEAD